MKDVLLAAQVRSGHRRLALAVDLDKHLSEPTNTGLQILDVHRRPGVHDVAEAAQVVALDPGGAQQQLDHGWREKEIGDAIARDRVEYIRRFEVPREEDDVRCTACDVRQRMEPGAMAQW